MIFAFEMTPMYIQLPIVLAMISLVYSATRYEDWPSILREAASWFGRMALFLLAIAAVLFLIAYFV
jgi:hypothetical protein